MVLDRRNTDFSLHGQSPKILAVSVIESRLDDIGHGSQIGASMRVDNTFGSGCGAGGERNSQHIVFVRSMAM